MTPAPWTRTVPVAVAVAGLVAASNWSIRAGAADYRMREATVAAQQQAIGLTPDQAECYDRLAWLASDDPRIAKAALLRAVQVNPRDTRARIELSLLAEAEGDQAAATRHLLQAAGTDHLFQPRWSLANYYFRHGDTASFWRWAREAADRVYGDPQPLFGLCARVVEDGNLINRLEISSPEVRANYLAYLLAQNRVDLIGPAVQCLLRQNREDDAPLLWQACERLLDARRVEDAAEIWNRQANAGRTPYRTSAADGTQLIVNSDFAWPPSSRGFDWRLAVVEGIGFSREDESRGLRISFSGRQPEDCEVLVQLVPVRGSGLYDLGFVYRTQGLAKVKGHAWRISDSGKGVVLAEGALAASEDDVVGKVRFEVPAECRLVRLALTYRRAPGTIRPEGFLVLHNVTLKPAGQPPIEGARVR